MKNIRSHVIGGLALALTFGAIPNLSGCDKTKSEHDIEVTRPDGTKEVDKAKTVEKPDGTIQTKTEHSTSVPTTP